MANIDLIITLFNILLSFVDDKYIFPKENRKFSSEKSYAKGRVPDTHEIMKIIKNAETDACRDVAVLGMEAKGEAWQKLDIKEDNFNSSFQLNNKSNSSPNSISNPDNPNEHVSLVEGDFYIYFVHNLWN